MITYETGTFLVDSSGEITVDYLFDGGWFQGQLGVFSLEGMDLLEPGSAEFMRAAARRASSSSDRGHVIIDDATEGARFEADLGYERNFNRHEYLDVKSFAMTPGEEVGFVMVQNTSFEETLENPEAIGEFGKSVLYSIPEANKTDSISQQVQFTSVANNGTIALEDYPTRGTKQDFNDVVYQVTGFAEGNLPELENHLDPQLDWVQTEVGTELLTYADSSFGNGDDNIENVENETSDEPEEASQSELTGVFEVGETGEITVDYLFDGGFLSGEVGIFSLEDLNLENIGSNGFNREIINRVTSNSAQGHIVMT